MKTFELSCEITVSGYTKVKAETLEAAIEEAEARFCAMGGMNSGNSPDDEWVVGEIDGTPTNIEES